MSQTHDPSRNPALGSAMRRGEVPRAIVAVCALAGLFSIAYLMGSSFRTPTLRDIAFKPASQESDDELTTGSIVFVPVLGNKCRQNLIDNRTWQVRENGTVPCDKALGASSSYRAGIDSATRLGVIRDSFRKSSP